MCIRDSLNGDRPAHPGVVRDQRDLAEGVPMREAKRAVVQSVSGVTIFNTPLARSWVSPNDSTYSDAGCQLQRRAAAVDAIALDADPGATAPGARFAITALMASEARKTRHMRPMARSCRAVRPPTGRG